MGLSDAWARYPCAECDEEIEVGNDVVMVEVCGGHLVHPAHRRCLQERP